MADRVNARTAVAVAAGIKAMKGEAATQGQANIYVCEVCHGHIVTRDVDAGVTPFLISCRATEGCKGLMKSSVYRVFDQSIGEGWEWYRPAVTETLYDNSIDHVRRGGLILRRKS